MKSSAPIDSALQSQFLSIVTSRTPVAYKVLQLGVLLSRGFEGEMKKEIPSVGCTPLQYCVETLGDEEIEIIEGLLPYIDTSPSDPSSEGLFTRMIPVPWGKKEIFFLLLESLCDEQRQWMILRSAASVKSAFSGQLLERLMLLQWELTAA